MGKILNEVAFPKQRATVPLNVVLMQVDEGDGHTPYATYLKDRDTGACFWGHYFKNADHAYEDFRDRCIREARACQNQGLELPWADLNKVQVHWDDLLAQAALED